MNTGELLSLARTKLDDLRVPYLWPEDDLLLYLAQAQDEAALRADLLWDDTTPACTQVPVQAGVFRYPLHPKVIKISSEPGSVRLGARWLTYASFGGWESPLLKGEPSFYRGLPGFIEVTPPPLSADAGPLQLIVYRLPLTAPDAPQDVPEIDPRFHEGLVYGMVRRAYERTDADTYAPDKAALAEQEFTRWFGPRVDADVQRKQHSRRVPVVRSMW